jgi:hypothetical protein
LADFNILMENLNTETLLEQILKIQKR